MACKGILLFIKNVYNRNSFFHVFSIFITKSAYLTEYFSLGDCYYLVIIIRAISFCLK